MPDSEPALATRVTFDFNDSDMVTTVEVAEGAIGGGWGICRVEVITTTPVRPDFLEAFLGAVSDMILSGGIPDLIARHDAEGTTDG